MTNDEMNLEKLYQAYFRLPGVLQRGGENLLSAGKPGACGAHDVKKILIGKRLHQIPEADTK